MMLIEKEFIYKRAYIDYRQLERQLTIDIGETTNIKEVYDYIGQLPNVSFTNVDLDYGYFDFNYKDMCLTISTFNNRGVVRLAESIELWDDENECLLDVIDFNDLERKMFLEIL